MNQGNQAILGKDIRDAESLLAGLLALREELGDTGLHLINIFINYGVSPAGCFTIHQTQKYRH